MVEMLLLKRHIRESSPLIDRVREKPRYYIFRTEVVGGNILGVVILFIVVSGGKKCAESRKEIVQWNRRIGENL